MDKIRKDKLIKKNLDKNGNWKYKKESFSSNPDKEFWVNVRGHDILGAICFYEPTANAVFAKSDENELNREFENMLIDKYNITMFTNTELYNQLLKAGLVNGME